MPYIFQNILKARRPVSAVSLVPCFAEVETDFMGRPANFSLLFMSLSSYLN